MKTWKESDRHAYLIMAHEDPKLLKNLIEALDDPRNDIYVHIDKKSSCFSIDEVSGWGHASRVFTVPQMKVYWGDFSIVKCELKMLDYAHENGPYRYYHMLSGRDFPIKSQDSMHDFFDGETGEFAVAWENMPGCGDERDYTYKYRYFWNMKYFDYCRGLYEHDSKVWKFQFRLQDANMSVQRRLNIDRSRWDGIKRYKGEMWFSITEDFVEYLLGKKAGKIIRKALRKTHGSDEFLIPTVIENSPFKERLAGTCLRLIDWNRGMPYVFTDDDAEEVIGSGQFFVRKISSDKSLDLCRKIRESWKQ